MKVFVQEMLNIVQTNLKICIQCIIISIKPMHTSTDL